MDIKENELTKIYFGGVSSSDGKEGGSDGKEGSSDNDNSFYDTTNDSLSPYTF